MRLCLKLLQILGLFSLFAINSGFADDVLPPVVVKVGQSSISRDEFIKEMMNAEGKGILENMIVQKVVELELEALKLPAVTESQIDGHISLMEKQLQITQGPYANINTFLVNQGLKMSDLRSKVKREIGIRRILGQKIEVKDEEITKYYEEYKNLFTTPECRRVIAVTVFHRESPAPKALQSDRSVDEARTIAEQIQKSWVENKDYVKTLWDTKQHFIRGYDEPFGIPKSMKNDKDFVEVFNLMPGAISTVIKDKNGMSVYKVIEDLPARVSPLNEVKEKVRTELIANKIEKCIKDGEFDKIKQKYKIEKLVEFKETK